jgi:hypothetical protein
VLPDRAALSEALIVAVDAAIMTPELGTWVPAKIVLEVVRQPARQHSTRAEVSNVIWDACPVAGGPLTASVASELAISRAVPRSRGEKEK